jgi:hypothetical protein
MGATMQDLINALKRFSAREVEAGKLPLPVKIVLLDGGKNPFYEMELSGKDTNGTNLFSNERLVPGTFARPKPYSVRFTAGEKSFEKDFLT